MTANGEVIYSGRLKDMLKVGGENVAAVEVEGFLGTHPKVKIAAVVGLPDEKYEEVPVAFIETLTDENLTEDAPTCLKQCENMRFEMVILTLLNTDDAEKFVFHCECVNNFKIRMQDISVECLPWWCPPLQGNVNEKIQFYFVLQKDQEILTDIYKRTELRTYSIF